MRKLKSATDNNQIQQPTYGPLPWNLEAECIIYARQSTTKQTIENRESSEAQTKDQLDKVHSIGWKDDKITVFIEGDGKRGVSGRLRIDERPGLNALMESIYEGKCKYVFVMNEARLFRDEWMIGPDTFIKACYENNVQVITFAYRYDFKRNPYDMDQFRTQCQISARFIKDHIHMMNRMRDRVAMRGQYFGGGIGIGYILDENNRPVPYEPHARIVRFIFKRYKQLSGNVNQLTRELNAEGYVFPAYEVGVNGLSTRLTIKNGGYGITRAGVVSLLTNVQYIGYWTFKLQLRRDEKGQPIINHPPIVDEADFFYAFNRLSPTTINGEINEQRETVTRYDQEGTQPSKALLKYVIVSPHGPVNCAKDRGRWDGEIREKYSIKHNVPDYSSNNHAARFDISLLDAAFVNKMFEHLTNWKESEEENNIGQLIDEQLKGESEEDQNASVKIIDEQILQTKPKIAHYNRLITGDFGLDDATLKGYGKELTKLRQTLNDLELAKKAIEKELIERAESQGLVDETLEKWNKYDLHEKRRVIRAVVNNVVISRVTPTWLKVEIMWKGIGTMLPITDIGYLWLSGAANTDWTQEEEAILREMYPYEHADAILEKLPNRAWKSTIRKAHALKIKRHVFKSPSEKAIGYLSANDRKFMEQHSIDVSEVSRGETGYIFWSDSETKLPLSEDDIVDTEELMISEKTEFTSLLNLDRM